MTFPSNLRKVKAHNLYILAWHHLYISALAFRMLWTVISSNTIPIWPQASQAHVTSVLCKLTLSQESQCHVTSNSWDFCIRNKILRSVNAKYRNFYSFFYKINKGNSTVACNATQPWLSYEKVNLHDTLISWALDACDLTSQFAVSSLLILESLKIWECPFSLNVHHGEHGWCSGESTCLLLMWPTSVPGFNAFFMWAEFVVGSLPSPGRFSPSTPVFPSAQKPKLPNFNLILKTWTC